MSGARGRAHPTGAEAAERHQAAVSRRPRTLKEQVWENLAGSSRRPAEMKGQSARSAKLLRQMPRLSSVPACEVGIRQPVRPIRVEMFRPDAQPSRHSGVSEAEG